MLETQSRSALSSHKSKCRVECHRSFSRSNKKKRQKKKRNDKTSACSNSVRVDARMSDVNIVVGAHRVSEWAPPGLSHERYNDFINGIRSNNHQTSCENSYSIVFEFVLVNRGGCGSQCQGVHVLHIKYSSFDNTTIGSSTGGIYTRHSE